MPCTPGGVRWTAPALGVFAGLPGLIQDQIQRRLEYAQQHPRMYPLSARVAYRGLRRFHVLRRWTVYYRVIDIGEREIIEVATIRPARARR